jgi:pilus assembly protein Flp/PilA
MYNTLKSLLKDESGATAIEYGLIAALVSVAAVGALQAMGTSLSTMFGTVSNKLDDAVSASS